MATTEAPQTYGICLILAPNRSWVSRDRFSDASFQKARKNAHPEQISSLLYHYLMGPTYDHDKQTAGTR